MLPLSSRPIGATSYIILKNATYSIVEILFLSINNISPMKSNINMYLITTLILTKYFYLYRIYLVGKPQSDISDID